MIRENSVRSRLLCPVSRSLMSFLLLGFLLLPLAAEGAAGSSDPQKLLDEGRIDEAIRLLTPQTTGNNAAAFNYLGRAYFALGDWDNAVRNCERAAQLEPRNPVFQLWLGRSYGEKANVAGALSAYALARKTVAAFTTARQLDPQSVPIARDLGEYYASAPSIVGGGSDKALALANKLAANYPSDAAWIRALADSAQSKYQQAEAEYMQSIHLSRESAGTYIEYARYLKGRKRWDAFQQNLGLAIKSANIQPSDRYDVAELLLRTNRNLPEAARQMRNYIQSGHTEESDPVFRAHFLLGEILLNSGDTTQSAAEYRAALALASNYRPAADALHRLGQR